MLNIKPVSNNNKENSLSDQIKPDYLVWMGDFNTNLNDDESIYWLFKKRKIYIYDYSTNTTTTQKYSSLQTIVNTREEKNVDCRIDGIFMMKRHAPNKIKWETVWIKFNDVKEG